MRFSLSERVAVEPERVGPVFSDEAFFSTWTELTHLGPPEVLSITRSSDEAITTIRHRYVPSGPLPAPARRIVNPDQLTWIETTTHDLSAGTSEMLILPDHHRDRLTATAMTAAVADPNLGGTRWSVAGDVKVSVPFFGKEVERAVVAGLARTIREQVPLIESWCSAN